jgi:hypothetical protein
MSEQVKLLIKIYKEQKTELSNIDGMIVEGLVSELERLIDRDNKLTALENAGVDNWEWYGDALEEYFKTKE